MRMVPSGGLPVAWRGTSGEEARGHAAVAVPLWPGRVLAVVEPAEPVTAGTAEHMTTGFGVVSAPARLRHSRIDEGFRGYDRFRRRIFRLIVFGHRFGGYEPQAAGHSDVRSHARKQNRKLIIWHTSHACI